MQSYKELKVWQVGIDIVEACYVLTKTFPKDELYGMTSQIRRSATSIPANIAEGYGRRSRKDYIRFLCIAQGSLKELETHLLICSRVGICLEENTTLILNKCDEEGRMLVGLIRSLEDKE